MRNQIDIYNPLGDSFNELTNEINNLEFEQLALKDDLEFYNLINKNIKKIEKENKSYLLNIKKCNDSLIKIDSDSVFNRKELDRVSKLLKPTFYLKYYSKEQKILRQEKKILSVQILEFMFDRMELDKLIELSKNSLEENRKKIFRFKTLNKDEIVKNQKSNENKSSKLKKELQLVIERKAKISTELKPVIYEIEKIKNAKVFENNNKLKAEKYSKDLDNAHNGYERKRIHVKCQEDFGDGNPNNIIKKSINKLEKYERDIKKLTARAEHIYKKFLRIIDEIIIDGNNMSYEGDVFIGLKALITATALLDKKYKITVIFDSDIRGLLKKNNQDIKKEFSKSVNVHIVASKQKADETILNLVSGNLTHYIISNDRFSDYFDKEVVKNQRILKHEIVNKVLLIHDLNIKAHF